MPSGGKPIGNQPSHNSAHSAVLRGPTEAIQIGMSAGECRIDFKGLPWPSAPSPR